MKVRLADAAEQVDEALEAGLARGRVGSAGVRSLAGTHEAVTGAVVDDRLIGLAGGLHRLLRLGNGGGDAGIVLGVEAVDRGSDVLHQLRRGRRTVEDEGCAEISAVRCEQEGLATAPAESC